MKSLPTGIFCPSCHNEVLTHPGLAPIVLLTVVHLQASRLGVDVECSECGRRFLYRSTAGPPAPHLLSHAARHTHVSTGRASSR